MEGINSNSNNNENFHQTIRSYAERLNEEKQKSLSYLMKINELAEELRRKDNQIAKLNKSIEQLTQKLSVYESVLTRSKATPSMRIGCFFQGTRFEQSVIQKYPMQNGSQLQLQNQISSILENNSILKEKDKAIKGFKIFEEFFIVKPYDYSDLFTQMRNPEKRQQKQINFVYKFSKSKDFDEGIRTFLYGNENQDWKPIEYFPNNSERGEKQHYKTIIYICNSELTTKCSILSYEQINQWKEINPSFYHFGICLLNRQTIKIDKKYYKVPIVYGFVTFFPFVNCFKEILKLIYRQNRYQNNLSSLEKDLLQFQTQTMRLDKGIQFTIQKRDFEWRPQNESFDSLIFSHSKKIFKVFTLQLLLDILILVLLQIPVTLTSLDQNILGKIMIFFAAVMKPLKYPYPMVVNLPRRLNILLQSPFPTFFGCDKLDMIEPFAKERAWFDLDQKIAVSWPVLLDQIIVSREYLLKQAMNIITNDSQIGNMNKIVKLMLEGEQIEQMKPFWRYFNSTQIYRVYAHEKSQQK